MTQALKVLRHMIGWDKIVVIMIGHYTVLSDQTASQHQGGQMSAAVIPCSVCMCN